eukprot:1293589-Ditylum_brightwellii.AAC.1
MKAVLWCLACQMVLAAAGGVWMEEITDRGRRMEEDKARPYQIGEKVKVVIRPDDESSNIIPKRDRTGKWACYSLEVPGASCITLHFRAMDFDPECSMEIGGQEIGQGATAQKQVHILTGKGLLAEEVSLEGEQQSSFWAPMIRGDRLTILIECTSPHKKAFFHVD